MTPLSRLIAYLLLPLLFFSVSYLLLYTLGSGLLDEVLLYTTSIGLSLLLAVLPPLAFHFIISSQLKEGFALLKSGKVVLPDEITLTDVLGHQISAWKLFQQHLDTEVCLQGDGELIYVQLGLDFTIPASKRGKEFVKHYKTNMTVFEAWVQRTIFLTSSMDRELVDSLASNALMNEEDEMTLRSKFLSALEMQPLRSVELPVSTAGLQVNRKIRKRQQHTGGTIKTNTQSHELEEDLSIDTELLKQLSTDSPS